MTTASFVKAFVARLAAIQLEDVFNPYADRCDYFDLDSAPLIRRRNLEQVLVSAMERPAQSLWIGRDLGHRGGRRTGLALTDELHLEHYAKAFGVGELRRATHGPLVAERTAQMIWDVLSDLRHSVFLWNAFPLHPHEKGHPLTNRCHRRHERVPFESMLLELLEALAPKHVVAVGKDAGAALDAAGVRGITVRHPSYGGERQFRSEVLSYYGL